MTAQPPLFDAPDPQPAALELQPKADCMTAADAVRVLAPWQVARLLDCDPAHAIEAVNVIYQGGTGHAGSYLADRRGIGWADHGGRRTGPALAWPALARTVQAHTPPDHAHDLRCLTASAADIDVEHDRDQRPSPHAHPTADAAWRERSDDRYRRAGSIIRAERVVIEAIAVALDGIGAPAPSLF